MKDLPPEPPSSEITPLKTYLNRREFIKNASLTLGTAAGVGGSLLWLVGNSPPPDLPEAPPAGAQQNIAVTMSDFDTTEAQTSFRDVTTYNNFYEFGVDKEDPARNAHTLQPRPWTISIEGE